MFKLSYVLRTVLVLLTAVLLIDAISLEKAAEKRTKIEITTNHGVMVVELYNETPKHRDNFVKLVKEGYYNDLLFHRVISDFMIQGGDPDSKGAEAGVALGQGGPGYTIEAEINTGLAHTKGALAAARQSDHVNPEKRSSGSQFYIVQGRKYSADDLKRQVEAKKNRFYQTKGREYFGDPANSGALERFKKCRVDNDQEGLAKEEAKMKEWVEAKHGAPTVVEYSEEQLNAFETLGGTPHLDGEYTVFGQIIEGMEVIDKIAAVKKAAGDRPLQDIKMTARVVK